MSRRSWCAADAASRACRRVRSSLSTGYNAARSMLFMFGLRIGRIGAPQRGDAVGGRAAGGGGAAVEKRGDLGVGQSGQVVIGDRLTLLGRKGGNGFGEFGVLLV